MNECFTMEDVAGFFNENGEPSDFGCEEVEVDKWVSWCENRYPIKGICVVKNWAVVECQFDDASKAEFREKGIQPTVLHAHHVIWDKGQRWAPGSFAASSLLVSIEENCLFVTRNTIYILVGKGHRKTISPQMLCAIQEALVLYKSI